MTHRSVLVLGFAWCFGLMSCDLFKTRTPAEPSQVSSNYIPPTDPSLVMQNMISAFQDGNAVNYSKSFSAGSFIFTPSTSARNKYGIDWTTWGKTQEQQSFEKILNHFPNAAKVGLAFEPFIPTYSNNTSQVETDYHITLPNNGGVLKSFNGRVQYILAQDQSGLWYISQWVDVGTTATDSTWSDLKGAAYSQW